MQRTLEEQVKTITTDLSEQKEFSSVQHQIQSELISFLSDDRSWEQLAKALRQQSIPTLGQSKAQKLEQSILAPMLNHRQAALKQHSDLVNTYKEAGLSVIELPDHPGSDSVFATDTGEQVGDTFLLGNLKNARRHGEEQCTLNLLNTIGIPILRADEHILEGGDLLYNAFYNTLFVGQGFRNSPQTTRALTEKLPHVHVLGLSLTNPKFYHLDCCFSALTHGELLIYPEAFNEEDIRTLTQLAHSFDAPSPLLVNTSEAEQYACNLVCSENKIFVPAQALTEKSLKTLSDWDFDVFQIPYDVLHSSGGSVRCSTLNLKANFNLDKIR